MSKKKKPNQKIRTSFRKRHETRQRVSDLTRRFAREDIEQADDLISSERLSGKGDLTRKRTVMGTEQVDMQDGLAVAPEIDETVCCPGRVLSVHGLASVVETEDGNHVRCATRQLLKSLSTDQRHVVAAGDRVWFRQVNEDEGFIERVEPRRGILCRTSRGRQHVIVANIDQLLIITSAAEPTLKPNLIDRLLVTAEKVNITPIICINKIDLVDAAGLQPLIGVFGQMGYRVMLLSATTGFGVANLRHVVKNKQSVVAGQSGVGKSSLLNTIEPKWQLKVRSVSSESQKGRHTTSAARLIPLELGGYVVDTPGVRQFQLWDVIPEEVANFYRDLRPFVSLCRFPNCTHTHESRCAVKDAVADGKINLRRYDSYCHLRTGAETDTNSG